jgi:hypothetical protein
MLWENVMKWVYKYKNKTFLRLTIKRKLNITELCNYEAVEVDKIRRPWQWQISVPPNNCSSEPGWWPNIDSMQKTSIFIQGANEKFLHLI